MDHLLQLRMLLPLSAATVIGAIVLWLFCRAELKRLSRRALIVFLCGGSIATVTAQKNMTNGTSAAEMPRMMMRQLASAPESSPTYDGMFPAWTNAVTNVCVTGMKLTDTSVVSRVHHPADILPAATGIAVYAMPSLASNVWSRIGTAPIAGGADGTIIEFPYSILPEGWLYSMFFRFALTDDFDGDGLSDRAEIGCVDVEPRIPAVSNWQSMTDCQYVWPMTTVADTGSYVIDLPCPYSANGVTYTQARICIDGIVYLLDPDHPNMGYVATVSGPSSLANTVLSRYHLAIVGFGARLHVNAPRLNAQAIYGITELQSGPATVIDFWCLCFADEKHQTDPHLIQYQVILPSGEPNVVYLTYGDMYPGEYFASRNVAIGIQCPNLAPLSADELCYNLTWTPTAEQFRQSCRVRFTIGHGTSPSSEDSDGDGFSDADEVRVLGTDPTAPDTDADSDGLPDAAEIRIGTDPDNADTDGDGLADLEELYIGTDPLQPDTDGDGVDDHDEVGQGSDPTDPTDEGDPRSRTAVSFCFGDHSESHSEKYRLEVKPLQGVGTRPRSFSKINELYGQCETNTVYLKPGWSYEVRLFHSGTKPGESVDYDYTLRPVGDLPANVFVVDEDSLFGRHNTDSTGRPYAGDGKVAHVYVLGDPRLVPDYDRDGKIDDADVAKAEEGKVFRFWINDDNDDEDKQENDSANDIPGSGPNHSNGHVDGRCDLLDFTPILLDVNSVVACVPESMRSAFLFRLRQQDEALNVVWTSLSANEARAFQTNDCGEVFGSTLSASIESAQTERIEDDGTSVSAAFSELLCADGGRGVVLVEGRQATTNLLWLDVVCAGKVVCSNALPCAISTVEQMYRFVSLRGAVENPEFSAVIPGVPLNQPLCTNDRDVFLLHGFNVDEQAAHAWGSEVFKRLWQSGSNARFWALTWAGDYNWFGSIFNALHYPQDVYQAFMTADAFKQLVETVQPDSSKRILMTQSLGNGVACEALRRNLHVDKYFMFDAAIPSEAVDGSLQDANAEIRRKYVPSDWNGYDPASWSANWHKWFSQDEQDVRGKMGWPNYFQAALNNATTVYNYYSTGDNVFKESDEPPGLLAGMFHWPTLAWDWPPVNLSFTGEMYCWQKQETLKGMATVAGTLSGGWGFHYWPVQGVNPDDAEFVRYSAVTVAAMVADGSITNNPVFNRGATELLNPNASLADQRLALAKHVPAISTAMGRTSAWDEKIENHDLNGAAYQNGWGRHHSSYGTDWQHSDMKDMAYFYVYKLYDEIVNQKGSLK